MENNLPIIRHYRQTQTKVKEWYRDSDGHLKIKIIKDEVVFEPIKEDE